MGRLAAIINYLKQAGLHGFMKINIKQNQCLPKKPQAISTSKFLTTLSGIYWRYFFPTPLSSIPTVTLAFFAQFFSQGLTFVFFSNPGCCIQLYFSACFSQEYI